MLKQQKNSNDSMESNKYGLLFSKILRKLKQREENCFLRKIRLGTTKIINKIKVNRKDYDTYLKKTIYREQYESLKNIMFLKKYSQLTTTVLKKINTNILKIPVLYEDFLERFVEKQILNLLRNRTLKKKSGYNLFINFKHYYDNFTITDIKGNVIFWGNFGKLKIRKTRQVTKNRNRNFYRSIFLKKIISTIEIYKCFNLNLIKITFNSKQDIEYIQKYISAIKNLKQKGTLNKLRLKTLIINKPYPFNGCLPKKNKKKTYRTKRQTQHFHDFKESIKNENNKQNERTQNYINILLRNKNVGLKGYTRPYFRKYEVKNMVNVISPKIKEKLVNFRKQLQEKAKNNNFTKNRNTLSYLIDSFFKNLKKRKEVSYSKKNYYKNLRNKKKL